MRSGATENAAVCGALLDDLIARGLSVDKRYLLILDGAKTLKKAVTRWRDGNMAPRWARAVLLEAEKRFRRVPAYSQLPTLRNALTRVSISTIKSRPLYRSSRNRQRLTLRLFLSQKSSLSWRQPLIRLEPTTMNVRHGTSPNHSPNRKLPTALSEVQSFGTVAHARSHPRPSQPPFSSS